MIYLVVKNLNGIIDSSIVPLINGRGNAGKTINEGDTWQDLKDAFQMRVGEPGRGELIIKYKEGVEHWVLPFTEHVLLRINDDNPSTIQISEDGQSYTQKDLIGAYAVSVVGLNNFGWDVIDIEE